MLATLMSRKENVSQWPVSQQVQDIEGCSVLQIMSFADILHSCYDFKQ